jgi:hypothetical protein
MTYNEQKRKLTQNVRNRQKERVKQQEKDISLELLKETTKKRFLTVCVGSIEKIENIFGHLWGGDEVDEDEMSPEQLKWYYAFLDMRTKIFDQCNDQISKFTKDLSKFDVNVFQEVKFVKDENDGQ